MTTAKTNNTITATTITLAQLWEIFPLPKKLERASVWTFFDDGSIATDVVVETLDETVLKMVLPAEECTIYLSDDNEVVIATEYHECEVLSTLRGV